MSKIAQSKLGKVVIFIAAVLMYSFSVAIFLNPAGLTPGGASGVAIGIQRLVINLGGPEIGTGILMALINVPLMILGIWKLGLKFMIPTIAGTFTNSFMVQVFESSLLPYMEKNMDASILGGGFVDPITGALFGGIISGVAIGMMIYIGSSFGGSDIVVKVLHTKYRYMKTGTFYIIVDGAIMLFGTMASFDLVLLVLAFSLVSVFLQSYFTDRVLYGGDESRMLYIITNKEPEIANRINLELHSGVTYLHGEGAYTGIDKKILLCVMRNRQVPKAREIVIAEDPSAFMIVTSASQVLGNGFKRLDSEDL
ncbi:MAG: YitT family protein [Ruminococcaceae bacterium]|nr:YitT family protein [Oscillospiraceae bacterium]